MDDGGLNLGEDGRELNPARRELQRSRGHLHPVVGSTSGEQPPEAPPRPSGPRNGNPRLAFDLWRLIDALVSRWRWLVVAAAGMAGLGFGWGLWSAVQTAQVSFVRNHRPLPADPGADTEGARNWEPDAPTVVRIWHSPELRRRVASAAGLQLTPGQVAAGSEITAEPTGDLIHLKVQGRRRQTITRIANAYAEEATRFLRELQAADLNEANESIRRRLLAVEDELQRTVQDIARFRERAGFLDSRTQAAAGFQRRAELDLRAEDLQVQLETLDAQLKDYAAQISRQDPALVAARDELDRARLRYTEEHPRVKELRAAVASIEARIAKQDPARLTEIPTWNSPLASRLAERMLELRSQRVGLSRQREELTALRGRLQNELSALPEKELDYARMQARFQSLTNLQALLVRRQQWIRMAAANVEPGFRVLERAQAADRSAWWRVRRGLGLAVGFGLLGLLVAGGLVVGLEVVDGRIRSRSDLQRVTQLPVWASLGDLRRMPSSARDEWARRTLAVLKSRLSADARRAFVCGFTSASPGEGRSTWVNLLAQAASSQGYRVLTIAGSPSTRRRRRPRPSPVPHVPPAAPAASLPSAIASAPTPSADQPILRVDLPAGAWDLERRAQWGQALQRWSELEDLVVLVELPPASTSDAILLAEAVPHVIWLCCKDMSIATETRSHLETLRQAGSNVAGVVFNRAHLPSWRKRLGHLIGETALVLAMLQGSVHAQEPVGIGVAPTPPNTNVLGSLSVVSPSQLAPWQQHLTLGPGDVLDINLYQQPDTLRAGLTIGPDGRLNYLDAQNVMAAGLTVDELRAELERILVSEKYYLPTRVVVRPVAYASKKYYLLGSVNQRGVFPLDRPVTIIEAIARAGGFVTSIEQRNTLVLTDLSRSFLIRKQSDGVFNRVDLDFEGLFLRGDLAQNVALAPEDYLYFPPLDLQEVYLLGHVRQPGVLPYTPQLTVLQAIAMRGGYADKAYQTRVLVVRGSLKHPQTFIVNTKAILAATSLDFELQPRDIVYVHQRPWAKVEDLIDLAIGDFMRAAVVTWTGRNVGPIIENPL